MGKGNEEEPSSWIRVAGVVGVVVNLSISISMVAVGSQYLEDPDNPKDSCTNGAAYWLYVAGICSLVTSILQSCAKIVNKFGKEGTEKAGNSLWIAEPCTLIWGSTVVFGAWAEWTYDESYAGDANYCPYTPMMFAFVLLILKWVLFPAVIVCFCLCLCCGGCVASIFAK